MNLVLVPLQVWLEFDDLLVALRAATSRGSVPVPSQLLGLLPPAPPGGWPAGFELAAATSKLAEGYKADTASEASNVRPVVVIILCLYSCEHSSERVSQSGFVKTMIEKYSNTTRFVVFE